MTIANGPSRMNAVRHGAAFNLLGAILLILLGIVLQLSELGYGHFRPESFWLFPMIAASLWNLFAIHANAPGARELMSFWPLLLITVGLAALLVRTSPCQAGQSSLARTGASYEK